MICDSEMTQNGSAGCGMQPESDASMGDLDASLFNALSMDGTSLMPNASGASFIDSLTNGMPDELNLPFSELDSLVSGNGAANEYCLSQLTSSLEFELSNMNPSAPGCGPQQITMSAARSCAPGTNGSNQALRRLLTEQQPAAPENANDRIEADIRNAMNTEDKPRGDLNNTLLQLLMRQQAQQAEQSRMLERLQQAILTGDRTSLITTGGPTDAPKQVAVSSANVSANSSARANSSVNSNVSGNGSALVVRTGHIQALLETSPPPPSGTATLRQYAHLSQSELRQTLMNTDYQQQLKKGVSPNSVANSATRGGQQAGRVVNNGTVLPAGPYGTRASTGSIQLQPSNGGQPQLVSVVKAESTASGVYDRRRSGTSTAATSPTSRQSMSAFASSIAADSEDCDFGHDDDDGDGDSFSQTTGTAAAGGPNGWNCTGGARRSAHNVIEKRYRSSINDRINELKHIVAANQPKIQKSGILRKTVEYIHHLRNQNDSLRHENAALKQALLNANSNGSHGSARFDAALIASSNRDANGHNEDSMLIQADSPNAFECYADSQSGHTHASPSARDSLLNAPSPPDAMMNSVDADSPRQSRSPPRVTKGNPQQQKQMVMHAKPLAPANKLNVVLSGRQLACSALDRTKLMLCVAMVTFVAVNPVDVLSRRVAFGSHAGVDHFAEASLGHAHSHSEFDFAEPHIGGRLLSSVEAQSVRQDTSPVLRMAAVWLVNLLVILALVRRLLFSCTASVKSIDDEEEEEVVEKKVDSDADAQFAALKARGDRDFSARNWDEAKGAYLQALQTAGCPFEQSEAQVITFFTTLVTFFARSLFQRRTSQVVVSSRDLSVVYSRLLLIQLYRKDADSEILRLAVNAYGKLQSQSVRKDDNVADAYISIAYAALTLMRGDTARLPLVRFALRQLAASALQSARKASANNVVHSEQFASFLFDNACSMPDMVISSKVSLTSSLTGAFFNTLLAGCVKTIQEGDAETTRRRLDELANANDTGDAGCECEFWQAATTLFAEFDRNWRDTAKRGVDELKRCDVREQLKQQTVLLDCLKRLDCLLQNVTSESEGKLRASLISGRIASPRAVSIAHLVYRSVRAFVVLSTGGQSRPESYHKLRSYLNSLSYTLQSVRRAVGEEAELDSLELNLAASAAKWTLTLRLLLCALHRESEQTAQGNERKCTKRKWIGECQSDLDTLAELNVAQEQCDTTRCELEHFEGCLHQLADSNPLQNVFVRLRVFAA